MVIRSGSDRLRQAVILCDRGRGAHPETGPPAPMVEVHGRPLLHYLIALLREQGFQEVVLLGSVARAQEYFGDGAASGVRLLYPVKSAAAVTARRLRAARHVLADTFLMLPGDTYWPLQFDRLWSHYLGAGAAAMLTVYANRDRYALDTVSIGSDGLIEVFDPTGLAAGLGGAAIGYAIVRRRLIDQLVDPEVAADAALYPTLARERQLAAHVSEHRYYDITSPERLEEMTRFLARPPTVILDRDGVLNRRPPPGEYVKEPHEFEWLPGALDALRAFHQAGYRVLIASNQAGVGRGHVSASAVDAVHASVQAQARAAGGDIAAFYYCPHTPDAGCECRKPRPGLLFQAQRDFALDLTRIFFLGDDLRDMQAADAAGARGLLVTPEVTLLDHARRLLARDDVNAARP